LRRDGKSVAYGVLRRRRDGHLILRASASFFRLTNSFDR